MQPFSAVSDLPQDVQDVAQALLAGLEATLGENLYGIYLYGAVAFPDPSKILDFDGHVIVETPFTDQDRQGINSLHGDLARDYPWLAGGGLDVYYILLEDARRRSPPTHQLRTDMRDDSWALHRAHILAGRYFAIYGPDPRDFCPAPAWQELELALDNELRSAEKYLHTYPGYGILQLCRVMFSFEKRDVVLSKRASGDWARTQFPSWRSLIEAAFRSHSGEEIVGDSRLLESDVDRFHRFALNRIDESRGA